VLRSFGMIFCELDKAFKHELPPRSENCGVGEIAKLNGQKLDQTRERTVKMSENEIAASAQVAASGAFIHGSA